MGETSTRGPNPSIPVSVGSIHDMLVTRMVDPPDAPGQLGRVERYDLREVIGEGGMGRVFLAIDRDTGKEVAVKMIRPELAGKPGHVRRFLNEARHMYEMDHPSVMKVIGVCAREGAPYFVMPFAGGGSLADRIRRNGPMHPDDIVYYSYQIARGLRYAHERGIIHRDLKPANALLASNGKAYLTDFGLSQTVFNDWIVDPGNARIEGTIPYMSPAVAEGKAEDTRCDIYAFGAMLYEMLTGSPPYVGKSPTNLLKIMKQRPPRPIKSRNPDADPKLTAIAEAAMARELHDRYASMTDVIADLDRVADGEEPLGAHGHATPPRPRRWSLAWRLALLLATTVTALAVWLPRGLLPTKPRRSRPEPDSPLPVVVVKEDTRPWQALLAEADAAYGAKRFQEAGALYDGALLGMAGDASTDPAVLDISRGSAQTRRNLAAFYVARGDMSLQRQVAATVAKLKELNPGCENIHITTDGQEIGHAFLAWCPLRDLSPVLGLPVRRLDLAATRVESLAALNGMPLDFLSLHATGITDLAPLSQFRLTGLHLNKTQVRDLSPLKGMPLNELFLSETPVKNISVLAPLPLTTLTLDGCTELHDLRPLAKCKSLQKLAIPAHSTDIDFLRDLPKLAYLSRRHDKWQTTAAEFWRQYDARDSAAATSTDTPALLEDDPGPRRLSDVVGLANAKVLVADDLNNPRRSAFGWGGWAGAYRHGRIHLHGSGAPAWGASNHNFRDFVCEVAARTSGGPHRGWGIAVWKEKDAGFEVLLDSDGRLSVVPCRWGRDKPELIPLEGLPVGPLRVSAFEPDAPNEMTVVFREGRKLEVFVNGAEACEPVVLSRRIEPTILQLASAGGEKPESLLELESYRVWQAATASEPTEEQPAWRRHIQAGRVALAANRCRAAAEALDAAIDAMRGDAATDATMLATAQHEAETLRDLAAFIPARAKLDPGARIEATKQKLQELNPDYRLNGGFEIEDGHITRISLQGCGVHDISPLRGLPLKDLNLRDTTVRDLAPLLGMPLARLNLWGVSTVEDITPLTNLPLTWLDLELTSVTDLTPLRGQQLDHLSLARTPIADIATLKGMPLKHLNLHKTIGVRDLVPLKGAPLTSIYLSEVPVTDIEPLRGMKLETLWLEGTRVADITPLSGMPIRVLFLSDTKVVDLSPLRGMPLEWLALDNMEITDLSPLHGMPLKRLRLGGSERVTDLSPLQECPTLEHLLLPSNVPASDFLRHLPKLEHLSYGDAGAWLTVTKPAEQFWREWDEDTLTKPGTEAPGNTGTSLPTDADAASRLGDARSLLGPWEQVGLIQKRLTELNAGYESEKGQFVVQDGRIASASLSKSEVADISPLGGLALRNLDLSQCPVDDISVLRGMPLEYLSVYRTKVTDLSVLRGMPLKELHCGETGVTDLTPVNDLKQIEVLNCWNMKVSDLSPLAGLPLKSLTLALCRRVTDIYPLSGMALTTLNLWNSGVSDISPLQGMRLQHLDIGETRVSIVRFLKGMPLRSLVMCGTPVSDISVIKGMPLTYLRIDRTKVTNIEPVRGMQLPALGLPEGVTDLASLEGMPLTYLHLIKCGVTDIGVVRELPLKELLLEDCPRLTDLTPIADCKTLEKLAIPKHCTDIESLRKLPNLKHLNSDNDFKWKQTAAEFWEKWDGHEEAGK